MSHAIDLPDTPEVRAQLDAAGAESMKMFGLDPKVVAVWEDGYRSAKDEGQSFEWWYFDMQFDDGSTIVTTFNTKPNTAPDGPLKPSVLLIRRDAQGKSRRALLESDPSRFSAATDTCDVKIGPNWVKGDLAEYTMHVEGDECVIDLTLTRGAPSWRPGGGVSFFDKAKTEFLAWVAPVPFGVVTGTITEGGTTRTLNGTGYHDHNWGNKLMGSGLDHWFWGRAHVDDFSLIFVMLTTRGAFGVGAINIPTLYLANGQTLLTDDLVPLHLAATGEVPGPGHQTYPTDLLWTWQHGDESIRFHITNPEMIEALDMTPDEPSWRKALTHLTQHPMYYDFNADIALDVDVAGVKASVTGRALYEKMMFH
ncbi:MAG: hypothetical protein WCP95_17740 [Actinomycetes bacterium]